MTDLTPLNEEKLVDDSYYYGEARQHALSASNIMDIIQGTYNPDQPSEKKVVYEIGKYFHVQTLEPHKLDKFDVRDNSRRKKGEYHLKMQEVEMCEGMKASHDANIEARGILYGPTVEYEVPAMTQIEGINFIGKCDIYNPQIGFIGDLKSTRDVDTFENSIEKWYCPQLWIYWKLFGMPTAYIIVEKNDEPRTRVMYPPKYFYAKGKELTLRAIEIYKRDYLNV